METIIVAGLPSLKGTATTEPGAAHCLSIHAGYRCQRSGACCTAGWHIPAEPLVVAAIDRHFRGAPHGRFFEAEASESAPAILALGRTGACVFFETAGRRSCAIQRALGEPLLPSACRHFPRVAVADARGVRITLSHFCPTAAGLLFTTAPIRVVPAPDTLTLRGTIEGLDATAALPPLLRPGMLMDFEGYEAWERGALDMLDGGGGGASAALATVATATRNIQRWSPGGETLGHCVTRSFAGASDDPAPWDAQADARHLAIAAASVPDGLTIPDAFSRPGTDRADVASAWREFDSVIRRYLASKLFAAWWPYLGLDLRAVVDAIALHAAVLRAGIAGRLDKHDATRDAVFQAIRDTDLLMVHLSDSRALARLMTQEP